MVKTNYKITGKDSSTVIRLLKNSEDIVKYFREEGVESVKYFVNMENPSDSYYLLDRVTLAWTRDSEENCKISMDGHPTLVGRMVGALEKKFNIKLEKEKE